MGSGQGQRTEYYAHTCKRDGKTNKYAYTTAVDEVFVSARDASLFKEDIAKENKGEASSVFNCFCCYTTKNSQKEGLNPGDPRNKTGLSPQMVLTQIKHHKKLCSKIRIQGKPIRRKYPNLRYPEERDPTQDYIQFKMLEYKGLLTLDNQCDKPVV